MSLARVRLKFRAHVEMGQSPPSSTYSRSPEDGLPFLQGCADFGETTPDPRVYSPDPTKVALPGDILLSVRAPVGELNVADRTFGIGRGLCAIHPEKDLRRFVWWTIHEAKHQLHHVSTGSTYEAVATEDVEDLLIVQAPTNQQRAIADYLDRETERLDALIAEKERLLKLLAEKRQALITRAVTRGLDPDAPMRDSGIPWIGDIPAHWNLVPLRFLASFVGGATPDTGKRKYWSGDIPWVSPKDMKHSEIDDSEDHVNELAVFDTALRMIPPGSVLVVVRGMILAHSFPAAITKAAVTVNQDMKALLCRERLDPWFLRDFFRGIEYYLITLADSSAHGTRKLETECLGQILIPLPPRVEQRQIVRYILDSTNRIDKARTVTERTVALLRERRAALIAAAVTGQIDVEYAK